MAQAADQFEFNAPKHFIDFTKEDIEVDESYFETAHEEPTVTKEETPTALQDQILRETPETVETQKQYSVEVQEQALKDRPEEEKLERIEQVHEETQEEESMETDKQTSEETEEQETMEAQTQVSKEPVKKASRKMMDIASVGVRQSPRLAAIAKALRRSNAARRSLAKNHETQVHKSKPRQRVPQRVDGLSAQDEADLETIANFKQKSGSKNRKQTSGSLQPLKATKPVEFHFATDTRLKSKEPVREEEQECVDFTKSLRTNITSQNKDAAKGTTVPQPFNLSESRKGKAEESNKFVSVAELNMKFHTKTPQRFRSKRVGGEMNEDTKRPKANNTGITVPHTPNLTTSRRTRSVNCLTQEQMEMQAFEEAQKQTFKARPVNKKIFETPATSYVGEKKLPTVPEPFNITDTRKVPSGVKLNDLSEEEEANLSLASLPHGGVSMEGKRCATKVQPFSFDSRDKAKMEEKQEKIKKVIEEEKRLAEFHAQPMPVFESGVQGVPAKKPPTPTRQMPFTMLVDQRGISKQMRLKRQMDEEKQKDSEQRKFHAQQGDVIHKAPFIPEKSKKPLTEISGFKLNTETRSDKRSEYDLHRKMHEEEMLAAKKEEEKRKTAEEAAEIARLRQDTVHKANPVRKYKPVTLQPPHQQYTIPKSPTFATDSRLRSRSQANSTLNLSSATFTAE